MTAPCSPHETDPTAMKSLKPPKAPTDWDQRFLVIASHIAGWSKDPSTKVGALAIRHRRILATGYNGLPTHVADLDERLQNRELRLRMTVHAEANCIAYAARHGVSLAGASFYVWPLMTCSQCAAQLIQADVAKIVVPAFIEPARWQESFDAARQMFIEAGVPVIRAPMSGPMDPDREESAAEVENDKTP